MSRIGDCYGLMSDMSVRALTRLGPCSGQAVGSKKAGHWVAAPGNTSAMLALEHGKRVGEFPGIAK
jgi:hypothetical protein